MRKPLKGRKVGKLTVVEIDGDHCICQCGCGNTIRVWRANLYGNNTRSCGCLKRTADGLSQKHVAEYNAWSHMKRRCLDSESKGFSRYGGRGITVCQRWMSFQNFLDDMGQRPTEYHSIDRIDNSGNYEPGNCRWSTPVEQANNTRKNVLYTYNGKTQTLSQWARELHLPTSTLWNRLHKIGWSVEKAFSTKRRQKSH